MFPNAVMHPSRSPCTPFDATYLLEPHVTTAVGLAVASRSCRIRPRHCRLHKNMPGIQVCSGPCRPAWSGFPWPTRYRGASTCFDSVHLFRARRNALLVSCAVVAILGIKAACHAFGRIWGHCRCTEFFSSWELLAPGRHGVRRIRGRCQDTVVPGRGKLSPARRAFG